MAEAGGSEVSTTETEVEVDVDLELELEIDLDADIDEIIRRILAADPEPIPARRVLVEAYLPHVKKYGHNPTLRMVYMWRGGKLALGDLVLCPPTPLRNSAFTGVIVSLDASNHPYKGPAKHIIKRITDADQVRQTS